MAIRTLVKMFCFIDGSISREMEYKQKELHSPGKWFAALGGDVCDGLPIIGTDDVATDCGAARNHFPVHIYLNLINENNQETRILRTVSIDKVISNAASFLRRVVFSAAPFSLLL